jgi:hypothetical protein
MFYASTRGIWYLIDPDSLVLDFITQTLVIFLIDEFLTNRDTILIFDYQAKKNTWNNKKIVFDK